MLKSRRGLLAAGLAVAVVGAFGVASTLNAGADQIPGAATDAPPAPPAAVAEKPVPPTVLPWGERPHKIKRGRGGESSKTLRVEGLSAAPADASGSTTPRGRYGPKGRSNRTSFLRTEHTDIAPPAPAPAPSSSADAQQGGNDDVNYLYAVGSQMAETDGIYANVTIGKPTLSKADYHSLAELALQSADGQQIVEVGWTVDRVVNGDDDPHLFVFHWVNKQPACYNGCGFVPYSKNVTAGATLPYDVQKKFGIQYFNGAWWIAYDTEWIGYFPEALWNDEGVKFNRSGLVQAFGEVASTTTKPCSQMGNGQPTDKGTAARMGSIAYLNGPPEGMNVRSTTDVYSVNVLSNRTFRFGGPGAC
nr:neprosin family prolyl endopeptidase [uncultured Actinoplanes sp.]